MESEYENDFENEEDTLEKISSSEIEQSRAEDTFDISFGLTQESLYNLIKDSQNSFFQLFSIAKLNSNNLDDTKVKLDLLMKNLRKKNSNQSVKNRTEFDQSLISNNAKFSIESSKDHDFDNLSADLSPQLFLDERKQAPQEINDHENNIDVKLEDSEFEDDFDLLSNNF
jgi:hypothetical protein